jgi:hypothetical protein
VLQVNPRAERSTINRIYRHLAKRYHPDNPETGDRRKFDELARRTRRSRTPRSARPTTCSRGRGRRPAQLLDEAIGCERRDDDRIVRERLLSVLYTSGAAICRIPASAK